MPRSRNRDGLSKFAGFVQFPIDCLLSGVYVQAAVSGGLNTTLGSKRCFAGFQMPADETRVDLQSI
jgi:hypothetical protein